jgi:peroxiredoxin
MRATAALLLALSMLAAPLHAQDAPKQPAKPAPTPRPAAAPAPRLPARIEAQVMVGDHAPDFELDGSSGRPVRLSRLRGTSVLLLFAEDRSLIGQLGKLAADLRPLEVRTMGVCDEKARTLESMASRDSLGVEWLADVTGEISALYGLYDFGRSRIRPGFVLVDRTGVVRMALLGQSLPLDETFRLVRYALTGE